MPNEALKQLGILDDQSEAKKFAVKNAVKKSDKIVDLISSAIAPDKIGITAPALPNIKNLFGNAPKPTEVEAIQDYVGDIDVTATYELNELSLQIAKTELSLQDHFIMVDLNERDDDFVTGLLTINSDIDGVYENMPLTGINNLTIDWTIVQGNKTKIRRKVSAVITKIIPSVLSDRATSRVYFLYFVASDVAKDWPNSMSRSYRNITLQELLYKLLADLNPLIVQPEITLLPDDKNIIIDHFVTNGFPNTLSTMQMVLSTYAKGAYRFYQRLTDKGQQFIIKPIVSVQPLNIEYNVGKIVGTESDQNAVTNRYIAVDHKPIKATDWQEIATAGGIASTTIIASPCRKRILRETYDLYTDESPITIEKSGKYLPFYLSKDRHAMRPTEESCLFIFADKTDSTTGNRTNLFKGRAKNKISPFALQDIMKIELYTGGNSSLSPGKSIIVTLPSTSTSTDMIENDNHLSGRWEIRKVSHLLGQNKLYMCTLEASKSRVDTPYGILQPLPEEAKVKADAITLIK